MLYASMYAALTMRGNWSTVEPREFSLDQHNIHHQFQQHAHQHQPEQAMIDEDHEKFRDHQQIPMQGGWEHVDLKSPFAETMHSLDYSKSMMDHQENARVGSPDGNTSGASSLGATLSDQEMQDHGSPGNSMKKENYSNSIGSPETPMSGGSSPGQNYSLDNDDLDEPGLRVPLVNSQGKVKTFRCKQCDYVSMTKLDFWEHTKAHIKTEKLLSCPKCPFVTEYKHHLEYHLRNHFGSKPYKCDKCSYSCVNKSMLNSHLKSHSNVYQFRCADCSYATKYCHSLKIHLRKYSHKPAMVLNPDGTPNPLPIIDVYGTRRGPKQKSMKKVDDKNIVDIKLNNISPIPPMANITNDNIIPSVSSNLQLNQQYNPLDSIASMPRINGLNGFNGNPGTGILGFPFNQLFSGFGIANSFGIPGDLHEDYISRVKASIGSFTHGISVGEKQLQDDKLSNEKLKETSTTTPLNLSTADDFPVAKKMRTSNSEPNEVKLKNGKASSRRKGKAIKLERRVIETDSDGEIASIPLSAHSPDSTEPKETQSSDFKETNNNLRNNESNEILNNKIENESNKKSTNDTTCNYCQITFGNELMHTVHMGYHGFESPFKCNMCGVACEDSISFFLHIARVKH